MEQQAQPEDKSLGQKPRGSERYLGIAFKETDKDLIEWKAQAADYTQFTKEAIREKILRESGGQTVPETLKEIVVLIEYLVKKFDTVLQEQKQAAREFEEKAKQQTRKAPKGPAPKPQRSDAAVTFDLS